MRPVAGATLLLALCAGCRAPAPPPHASEASAPGPAPTRARTIRMDIPLEADVGDVPRLMARQALQQAGYTVEASAYRDNVIAIQGLVDGQVDVAILAIPTVLAAVQRGAAIAVIMEGGAHTRRLVTAPAIRTCADLHGKGVSVANLVSAQNLALDRFIARHCPGTEIEKVVISGTNNRLAALLAGRTAGAVVDLMTLLEAQREVGLGLNVLASFGEEFPGLGGAAVIASRAFLDRYPDTARDLVREWLLATRRIQDPAVLKDQIEQHLALPPGLAGAAADAYLANHAWDVNGGLADGFMAGNIEFAEKLGVLKPGLTPAMVEDRRSLDAALAEIGRH